MRLPTSLTQLVRPVPLGLVQGAANAALTRVLARHPKLFDRLGEHIDKTFAIVPADLPLVFVIAPASRRVTAFRSGSAVRSDVRICGPVVTLLALAEGRLDGDAEFFARDLSIEGDMEAILALRNAMDDCRIDLPSDLAPSAGPLRRPIEGVLQGLRSVLMARGDRRWN